MHGHSEIPRTFHVWGAVSLLAAAVGNSVWYEHFRDDPLYPNMYILLLADSGKGKGVTCNNILRFLQDEEIVGTYRGKLTAAHLHDVLSSPRWVDGAQVQDSRCYMVMPELSYSIGEGVLADSFIKMMTEFFGGGSGHHKEGTRTNKEHLISEPCLNWIAGSTEEWMTECVSPAAITGGFFARNIVVHEKFDPSVRVYRPVYPNDYREVKEHLEHRVQWLCRQVRGCFQMSLEADELARNWYDKRPGPADVRLAPTWQRELSLIQKLSMILALSEYIPWIEPQPPLIIQKHHVMNAQTLLHSVRNSLVDIMGLSTPHKESKIHNRVVTIIRQAGRVQRSTILRKGQSFGLNADGLDKIEKTLLDSGEIERDIKAAPGRGRPQIWYVWRKRRAAKDIEDHSDGTDEATT